jgi:hypothetical protein
MVPESRLWIVRKLPILIVLSALIFINFVFVGTPSLQELNNYRGYAIISSACFVAIAASALLIGRRATISSLAENSTRIIYLPQWAGAMLASALVTIFLLLLSAH